VINQSLIVVNFKIRSIKKYFKEGLSPNAIFKEAGFNLNTIGKEKPKSCLIRWRRIYNNQGNKGFSKRKQRGLR